MFPIKNKFTKRTPTRSESKLLQTNDVRDLITPKCSSWTYKSRMLKIQNTVHRSSDNSLNWAESSLWLCYFHSQYASLSCLVPSSLLKLNVIIPSYQLIVEGLHHCCNVRSSIWQNSPLHWLACQLPQKNPKTEWILFCLYFPLLADNKLNQLYYVVSQHQPYWINNHH